MRTKESKNLEARFWLNEIEAKIEALSKLPDIGQLEHQLEAINDQLSDLLPWNTELNLEGDYNG